MYVQSGVAGDSHPRFILWGRSPGLSRAGCLVTIQTVNDAKERSKEADVQADAELDLRGVICPYNFVKTKLKLETMGAGQVLAVILDDGEPIRNVPRSVSDDGHTVLRQEPFDRAHRVIIKKRSD